MLPNPDSINFSVILRAKRLALGISREQLASQAGISKALPRRYEEVDAGDHCKPSAKSFKALNDALRYFSSISKDVSKFYNIEKQLMLIPEETLLKNASIDELLQTLQLKIKELQNAQQKQTQDLVKTQRF